MLDDFRSAYRNTHTVLGAWTGKATTNFSVAAFGLRLATTCFPPRSGLALLSLLSAVARSPWTPWVGVGVLAVLVAAHEMETSHLQARYFVDLDRRIAAPLKPGTSTSIRFPDAGPYDQRLRRRPPPASPRRVVSERRGRGGRRPGGFW